MSDGGRSFSDPRRWHVWICETGYPRAGDVRSSLVGHGVDVAVGRDPNVVAGNSGPGELEVVVLSDRLDGWLKTVGHLRRSDRRRRVLLVSDLGERSALVAALSAGVDGIVRHGDPPEAVYASIRGLCEQGVSLPRSLTGALVGEIRAGAGRWVRSPNGAVRVTDREWQTLQLMTQGLPTREMAAELFISEGTVRSHVSALLGKLGVSSRAEAVSLVAGAPID